MIDHIPALTLLLSELLPFDYCYIFAGNDKRYAFSTYTIDPATIY